jgi:hypothetical protein
MDNFRLTNIVDGTLFIASNTTVNDIQTVRFLQRNITELPEFKELKSRCDFNIRDNEKHDMAMSKLRNEKHYLKRCIARLKKQLTECSKSGHCPC